MRIKRALAVLACTAAAILPLSAAKSLPAPHLSGAPVNESVSPDFTCPIATLCTFSGNNLNGTVHQYPVSRFADYWFDLSSPRPWSMHNNTSYPVYLLNISTQVEACMQPKTEAFNLYGYYGYAWIDTEHSRCSGVQTLTTGR